MTSSLQICKIFVLFFSESCVCVCVFCVLFYFSIFHYILKCKEIKTISRDVVLQSDVPWFGCIAFIMEFFISLLFVLVFVGFLYLRFCCWYPVGHSTLIIRHKIFISNLQTKNQNHVAFNYSTQSLNSS